MPILVIAIIWIATVFGRRVCRRLLGTLSGEALSLELSAFGAAVGLGVLALGVMTLGLITQLRPAPVAFTIIISGLVGWREHLVLINDIRSSMRTIKPTRTLWLFAVAFAFFGLVALFECLAPPTPLEWDSLSYHLADPKIYLRYGRLLYLPWESHSNFAFTMEMLYAVGLMLGSAAAAKAFHLALAVVGALSIYLIGVRHINARTGKLAAVLFVSMPLVFWEAGTAYVDLAAAAYGALALLAVMNGLADGGQRRWLWVGAVVLGLMLGVKATSIITIVILCGWILVAIVRSGESVGTAFRTAAMVGVVAAVIGCPWYVKSTIYTGNPVYPFAFSVFGGRYWNAEQSANYNAAQQQFGVGHLGTADKRLPKPAELILSPWNLIMYSMPGHVPPAGSKANPFNDFPSTLVSVSPFLLAALFMPIIIGGSLASEVKRLGYFSLVSVIVWFFLTQQVRYLLPVLAPVCLVSVACMDAAVREKRISGYALAALLAVSIVGSALIGLTQLAFVGPVVIGRVTVDEYLGQRFGSYRAMQYLNALPPDTRVVFYGEPLGFYCNQPYMWGEEGHSTLIPYEKLGTSEALRKYFLGRNIHYILWNVVNLPPGDGPLWANMVHGLFRSPDVQPVFVDRSRSVAVFRLR